GARSRDRPRYSVRTTRRHSVGSGDRALDVEPVGRALLVEVDVLEVGPAHGGVVAVVGAELEVPQGVLFLLGGHLQAVVEPDAAHPGGDVEGHLDVDPLARDVGGDGAGAVPHGAAVHLDVRADVAALGAGGLELVDDGAAGPRLDHDVDGHDVLARPQVREARLRARVGGVVGLVRLVVGEDPGGVDAVLVLEAILGRQVPGTLD